MRKCINLFINLTKMEEKIKSHKIFGEFIHNKCASKKKGAFTINFHPDKNNPENLSILYDNLNYIHCLIKKRRIK